MTLEEHTLMLYLLDAVRLVPEKGEMLIELALMGRKKSDEFISLTQRLLDLPYPERSNEARTIRLEIM